jgi:DNA-binding transcriptional regulator GbsR (MarR family)
MDVQDAKQKFINSWGSLGSSWGINRTMAQVHALLIVSEKAMSTEEVMEQLNISRGNANMNLRALLDWGLVHKELKLGERKEYFAADKEMWSVAKKIIRERRKREIHPIKDLVESIRQIDGAEDDKELRNFQRTISNIGRVINMGDAALDRFLGLDETWLVKGVKKIFR